MSDRLRILALEPYYGGSHRAVLDGLVERIDAEWTLLTLPARKWKWRMRGAAITMAEGAARIAAERTSEDVSRPAFDLIFTSTFVNLAEFRGLVPPSLASTPTVLYFHENQLVYPNRHLAEWDFQFPLTNITSALSADTCVFNTEWNRERFVDEIAPFLAQFPDHRPGGLAERIAGKSLVIAPPFDPAPFDDATLVRGERVRIVWPHRWEHDKDPDTFIDAAVTLAAEGLDFEVAIAGQSFRDVPASIANAQQTLGTRLVHLGEPSGRIAYAELLAGSDIAVSTATNEFFGLAMVEAAYTGCYPLVPDRLAYPELYPAEMRWRGREGLVAKLRSLIVERPAPGAARGIAARYTFDALLPRYQELFERIARGR